MTGDGDTVSADIKEIANEIITYISDRKNAADTIDGIANWWVLRQRIYEERSRVEKAVSYLCSKGVLKEQILADGSVLYSAEPNSEVWSAKK